VIATGNKVHCKRALYVLTGLRWARNDKRIPF
jgi:hypothetical protein